MKKILLAIGFFVALNTEAQVVNKFRDSSVFFKGVRFDSTLVFKGLKAGSTADTNVVVISSTGKASKVSKSAFLGDLPIYSISDSNTVINYDVLNSQNTPPVSPSTGDVYLVGTSPSGAWVGHPKDIAEWNGSAWVFTDGVQGDFLYNATNALTYIFRSGNWVQTTGIPALHNGNTISSGLKIGTRNNKDFNFISNNILRGGMLANGSFRVANQGGSGNVLVGADSLGVQRKLYIGDGLSLSNDSLLASGGGGSSAIFPNGVKIIEDTAYTLSPADAGYYLIAINANTHFIMPDTCPFSVGDVIGLSGDLDTTTFDLSSSVTDIELFTGQSTENGETFIMQCVDVGAGAEMLPLSAIKNDNGVLKTLNKYLYDQSQIAKNPRWSITKSEAATDADFSATPGTAYVLPEVSTNDKVITLASPQGGDMYRFNNVAKPTNNFIVSPTFFLPDGTPSNTVPASKITIIQYDTAQSRFNLISSQ